MTEELEMEAVKRIHYKKRLRGDGQRAYKFCEKIFQTINYENATEEKNQLQVKVELATT